MDAYDRFCQWDATHDDEDLFPPRPAAPGAAPTFALPPVTVSADPACPPATAFRRRPAEEVMVGDYINFDGGVYRVAGKRGYKSSILLLITLYPVTGGRPVSKNVYPRNWFPVAKGATQS